ncbi:MAG: EamA family transporter [Elusimicrobiota bacterium]
MNLEVSLYLFVAIICWGFGAIFDKLTLRYFDPVSAFYSRTFIIIVFFSIFVSTRFLKTINDLKIASKSGLIYISLSVIVAMVGVFAYLKAMSFSEASRIVPISSTYPLVTFIIAVLFLGESFTLTKLIGTIFVILGVYFISK